MSSKAKIIKRVMQVAMGLFALVSASIMACYKWGDWRDWKKYYPTILYLIIGDAVCNLLMYHKPLWSYHIDAISHVMVDLTVAVFTFPCTVILFLTYFPKKIYHGILYIVLWASISSVVEWIALLRGELLHHNGWDIWITLAFDTIMYALLYLHYKKPLWVWPISFALAFIMILYFKIPFASMR